MDINKQLTFFMMLLISVFNFQCSNDIIITEKGFAVITLDDIKEKYKNHNWEVRLNAIQSLQKNIDAADKKSIKMTYLAASQDSHPAIRIEALKGLAVLKDRSTLPRLKEMATKDTSNNVKWYSIRVLTLFQDTDSFVIFEDGMSNEDWLIREASIEGILELQKIIPDKEIIPLILKAVKDDNESIKIKALTNTRIKNDKIFKVITGIYNSKKETNHPLLKASLKAMNGYMLPNDLRDSLITLLGHRNIEVRILAFRILKKENDLKRQKNISVE